MVDSMEILQAVTKVKDIFCGSSYRMETFALTTNISNDRRLWEFFFILYMGKWTAQSTVLNISPTCWHFKKLNFTTHCAFVRFLQ